MLAWHAAHADVRQARSSGGAMVVRATCELVSLDIVARAHFAWRCGLFFAAKHPGGRAHHV